MKLKTLVRAITPFKEREKSNSDADSVNSSSFLWDLDDVNLIKVLEAFYHDFYPEKMDLVHDIIHKYQGEEILLLQQLCDRYQLSEKEMQRYINVGKRKQVKFVELDQNNQNASNGNPPQLAQRSSSRGGLHHKPGPPISDPPASSRHPHLLASPSLNKSKNSQGNKAPLSHPSQAQSQYNNQAYPNSHDQSHSYSRGQAHSSSQSHGNYNSMQTPTDPTPSPRLNVKKSLSPNSQASGHGSYNSRNHPGNYQQPHIGQSKGSMPGNHDYQSGHNQDHSQHDHHDHHQNYHQSHDLNQSHDYNQSHRHNQSQDYHNQGYQSQSNRNQGYQDQGYQDQNYNNQGNQSQGYKNQGNQSQGYQNHIQNQGQSSQNQGQGYQSQGQSQSQGYQNQSQGYQNLGQGYQIQGQGYHSQGQGYQNQGQNQGQGYPHHHQSGNHNTNNSTNQINSHSNNYSAHQDNPHDHYDTPFYEGYHEGDQRAPPLPPNLPPSYDDHHPPAINVPPSHPPASHVPPSQPPTTKLSMKHYQGFNWDLNRFRSGIGIGLSMLYEEHNPSKSPNLTILEKKGDEDLLHLLRQLCRRHRLTESQMESYLFKGLEYFENNKSQNVVENSPEYQQNTFDSPNSYLPLPTPTQEQVYEAPTVPFSPPPLSEIISSFKDSGVNGSNKVNDDFKNSIRSQLGITSPVITPVNQVSHKTFNISSEPNVDPDVKVHITNELKGRIQGNSTEKSKKPEDKKTNLDIIAESTQELQQEITDKEEIENLKLEMSLLKIKNDQLTSDSHNLIALLNEEKILYAQKLEAEKMNLTNETERKLWMMNTGRKVNKEVQVDDKEVYESKNRLKEKLKLEEERTKNIELESIKRLKENKNLVMKNLQLQNLIKNLYEDKKILLSLLNLLNNVPSTVDNNKIIYGYINNILLENIEEKHKLKLLNTINQDSHDDSFNSNYLISEKLDRILKWKHSKDDEFFKKTNESSDDIINTIDSSSHALDFYNIFNLVGASSDISSTTDTSNPTNLDNNILETQTAPEDEMMKRIENFEEKFLYSDINDNENINKMKSKVLEDLCSPTELTMLKNINKTMTKKSKKNFSSTSSSVSPPLPPSSNSPSLSRTKTLSISPALSESLSSSALMTEQYNLAKEFLHTQKTKSMIEMKMSETNKKIFELQKKELLSQSSNSPSPSPSPITPSPLKSSTIPEESVTDWVLCFDPKTGKRYYHSHSLKKSTWKKPANFLLRETTKKLTGKDANTTTEKSPEEYFANNSSVIRSASPAGPIRNWSSNLSATEASQIVNKKLQEKKGKQFASSSNDSFDTYSQYSYPNPSNASLDQPSPSNASLKFQDLQDSPYVSKSLNKFPPKVSLTNSGDINPNNNSMLSFSPSPSPSASPSPSSSRRPSAKIVETRDSSPWVMALDPKTQKKYWFNRSTKVSTWRRPAEWIN